MRDYVAVPQTSRFDLILNSQQTTNKLMMVSVVAVVQVGVSVVAKVAMVGKGVAVAVVGIPVVVVSIGISFRSSGSSGLGISGPLAKVVAVETAIGESVKGTSVDGGHMWDSSHKRVANAVVAKVGISFSSGLGISRPLAIVVSKGIGVSVVAGVGKPVAVDKRVAVVAVVGVSLSIGLSCHGSKEAKSSNGLES